MPWSIRVADWPTGCREGGGGGWTRRMRIERGKSQRQSNEFVSSAFNRHNRVAEKKRGNRKMRATENWEDERQRYVTLTKRPESLTEKASGGIDNDANTSPSFPSSFSFLSISLLCSSFTLRSAYLFNKFSSPFLLLLIFFCHVLLILVLLLLDA